MKLVGYLQLLFVLCLCAILGTPQTAFSSIEHFMLNEHFYEDRCKVLFALNDESDGSVYCYESREAYNYVYNMAAIAFALALIPAFYSSKYMGFSVTNLLCFISLGAGSMVITSSSEEQWLDDRMGYGYALVAFSGPFAIINALNIISQLGKSRGLLIFLLFLLFATLQLSPLVWTVISWQFSNIDLTVSDLFKGLLWLPAVSIILTLALMPLTSTSQDFDLLEFIRTVKSHFFFFQPNANDRIDAVNSNYMAGNEQSSLIQTVFSQPFISLLLAYTANSTSMDLMYLGGEARASFHKELAVWVEITLWSPVIAAVFSPLIISLNLKRGINCGLTVGFLLSTVLTLAQFWSIRISWLFASLVSGLAQSAIVLATTLYLMKIIETEECGILAALFLLASSLCKLWFLPIVESATEFDTLVLGWNPYSVILCAQLLFSSYSLLVAKIQAFKERRWLLELEAIIACDP